MTAYFTEILRERYVKISDTIILVARRKRLSEVTPINRYMPKGFVNSVIYQSISRKRTYELNIKQQMTPSILR